MTRAHALLVAGIALLAPVAAHAQSPWNYEVSLGVRGIFDDNPPLALDGGTTESQILVAVQPGGRVEGAYRFFDLSAGYALTFFNYQDADALTRSPDLVHDGHVRLAITRWEGVDISVGDRVDAVGIEYGLPRDEPQNITQRNTASGRLGFEYDARVLLITGGYDADRVDYLADMAPSHLVHGPHVGIAREITRDLRLDLVYRLRLTDYDEAGTAANQAPVGDLTTHNAYLQATYDTGPRTNVDVRAGYAMMNAALLDEAINTFAAEADVNIVPTPYLAVRVGGHYGATADLAGNPGVRQEAVLGATYQPLHNLSIGAAGAYGALNLSFDDPAIEDETRTYIRAEATVEYEWLRWVSTRIGFVHHQYDGPSGAVAVNRGFLGIVARYGRWED